MICTILVLVPVFLLSQVSTKRSERERDRGRKATENDFFPTTFFRFLLVENIFWSQKLFTGIILLCTFWYLSQCLGTYQFNIVIVVLLLLGYKYMQGAILLPLTFITKHYMFKTQFKLDYSHRRDNKMYVLLKRISFVSTKDSLIFYLIYHQQRSMV